MAKEKTGLRQPFDRQQRQLLDEVLVLGSQVEEALQETVDSLKKRDKAQARRLLDKERKLHQSRAQIETDTLTLLSTQQPMAGDLRFLAAVLQITLELGAISYHIRDITDVILRLGDRTHPEPFVSIIHMAGSVTKMLRQALEAFSKRDILLAQAIAVQDNEIDDLYAYISGRLLAASKIDVSIASDAIHLTHIAHLLERVGDRATNICEWVIYAVTGYLVEMNTELTLDEFSKSDFPSLHANL